ncbi:hypothetical protein DY000_02054448 [Brassica cretica]|uniref:Uncharacterized protein n=1 Tax=Brassica cretica TaxID=69181 RepID=A0ABQ7AG25_BRACR|nr:hypothetical protein DY000_02054448 [Brassica cretica]
MCARLYGSSGARTGQGQSYLCCASHPIPGCRRFLLYIYMGVSLARSYREDEAIPTWIHKKARTRYHVFRSWAAQHTQDMLTVTRLVVPNKHLLGKELLFRRAKLALSQNKVSGVISSKFCRKASIKRHSRYLLQRPEGRVC